MQGKITKQLNSYSQAYDYALKRLTYRDYSEEDLKILLQKNGCPENVLDEVVAKLKEYSLIDDARYAQRVYSAWLGKKSHGVNHLRMEFRKKKVREEFASAILASVSDDMQLEWALNSARKWQEKNNKKYGPAKTKAADVAKLARTLGARGFTGNIIRMALNRLDCDFAE